MATKTIAKTTRASKTTKASKATRATKPTRATGAKKVATVMKATKASGVVPALSPEQVGEVLELIKGANSIELKLSVPLVSHQATIRAIGLDPSRRSRGRRSSSIRLTLP